jgi:hypothetical protein
MCVCAVFARPCALRTQGAQHSAQIFSLAVLLSSIFVYNQVGAIDAIAIERLAMVCELAKRIKDRSAAPGGPRVAHVHARRVCAYTSGRAR